MYRRLRHPAVIGSPMGKGNTYRFVAAIEEKTKSLGDVRFDYPISKDMIAHLVAVWVKRSVKRELPDEIIP